MEDLAVRRPGCPWRMELDSTVKSGAVRAPDAGHGSAQYPLPQRLVCQQPRRHCNGTCNMWGRCFKGVDVL